MFNKTLVFPRSTEYVPYEKTIIEKRAPTDDSIRIYDEMKDKVRKSIIDTIEINDNSFNVKAIAFNDFSTMEIVCSYAFTINGKEITGEIRNREIYGYDKTSFVKKLFTKVAENLALELFKIIHLPEN